MTLEITLVGQNPITITSASLIPLRALSSQAAESASQAATSAAEAAESALDADDSAGASANSATASANSATASATSETNAANSATASANSATASANSATASANSATASANSATASATSETNAANSATASANSATNATTSEKNSEDSNLEAESWANEDENVPVKEYNNGVPSDRLPVVYSAKHQAINSDSTNRVHKNPNLSPTSNQGDLEFHVDQTDGTLTAGHDEAKGFATTTYTGNGTTQSIVTGVDMATGDNGGFIWRKWRSGAGLDTRHVLVDTVRLGNNFLSSNTDSVEANGGSVIDPLFSATGFTANGDNDLTNKNGDSYIAWSFQTTAKATGTTSAGKPYTAHYNEAMGFSVVGYDLNKASQSTVPHYLGEKPQVMIFKSRDRTEQWEVALEGMDGNAQTLQLNSDAARSGGLGTGVDNTYFGDILFTQATSVDADSCIAYCFRSVPNFSKIKTYVGTGATGNQVDLGLDMTQAGSFVMIKRLDGVGGWVMLENVVSGWLYADRSDASIANGSVVFNSHGVEMTSSFADVNVQGGEYLIMAFTPNYNTNGTYKTPSVPTTDETNANLPISWEGTPFVDPMAVGANPVAKIYPDGSIVGSTDNGSYTRWPNGDLECRKTRTTLALAKTGATGSLFASAVQVGGNFPAVFILPPETSIQVIESGNVCWITSAHGASVTNTQWQSYTVVDSVSSTEDTDLSFTAKGRWKA